MFINTHSSKEHTYTPTHVFSDFGQIYGVHGGNIYDKNNLHTVINSGGYITSSYNAGRAYKGININLDDGGIPESVFLSLNLDIPSGYYRPTLCAESSQNVICDFGWRDNDFDWNEPYWHSVDKETIQSLNFLVDGDTLYKSSSFGLFKSRDRGFRWEKFEEWSNLDSFAYDGDSTFYGHSFILGNQSFNLRIYNGFSTSTRNIPIPISGSVGSHRYALCDANTLYMFADFSSQYIGYKLSDSTSGYINKPFISGVCNCDFARPKITSDGTLFVSNYQSLWKSVDGASSFAAIPSSQNSCFYFLNSYSGFVNSSLGIKKTINGGTTWDEKSVPSDIEITDLYFIDMLSGWVAGRDEFNNPNKLYYTSDGGDNWINQSELFDNISLGAGGTYFFYDDNELYVYSNRANFGPASYKAHDYPIDYPLSRFGDLFLSLEFSGQHPWKLYDVDLTANTKDLKSPACSIRGGGDASIVHNSKISSNIYYDNSSIELNGERYAGFISNYNPSGEFNGGFYHAEDVVGGQIFSEDSVLNGNFIADVEVTNSYDSHFQTVYGLRFNHYLSGTKLGPDFEYMNSASLFFRYSLDYPINPSGSCLVRYGNNPESFGFRGMRYDDRIVFRRNLFSNAGITHNTNVYSESFLRTTNNLTDSASNRINYVNRDGSMSTSTGSIDREFSTLGDGNLFTFFRNDYIPQGISPKIHEIGIRYGSSINDPNGVLSVAEFTNFFDKKYKGIDIFSKGVDGCIPQISGELYNPTCCNSNIAQKLDASIPSSILNFDFNPPDTLGRWYNTSCGAISTSWTGDSVTVFAGGGPTLSWYPTYSGTTQNGLNVIDRHMGGDNYFNAAIYNNYRIPSEASGYTFFSVASLSSGTYTSNGGYYWTAMDYYLTNGWPYGKKIGFRIIDGKFGLGDVPSITGSSNSTVIDNGYNIISCYADYIPEGGFTPRFFHSGNYIFNGQNDGDYYWDDHWSADIYSVNSEMLCQEGSYGEFLFYPKVLELEERQKVEGYLAHKWGIQDKLDDSHPYRYSPPIADEDPHMRLKINSYAGNASTNSVYYSSGTVQENNQRNTAFAQPSGTTSWFNRYIESPNMGEVILDSIKGGYGEESAPEFRIWVNNQSSPEYSGALLRSKLYVPMINGSRYELIAEDTHIPHGLNLITTKFFPSENSISSGWLPPLNFNYGSGNINFCFELEEPDEDKKPVDVDIKFYGLDVQFRGFGDYIPPDYSGDYNDTTLYVEGGEGMKTLPLFIVGNENYGVPLYIHNDEPAMMPLYLHNPVNHYGIGQGTGRPLYVQALESLSGTVPGNRKTLYTKGATGSYDQPGITLYVEVGDTGDVEEGITLYLHNTEYSTNIQDTTFLFLASNNSYVDWEDGLPYKHTTLFIGNRESAESFLPLYINTQFSSPSPSDGAGDAVTLHTISAEEYPIYSGDGKVSLYMIAGQEREGATLFTEASYFQEEGSLPLNIYGSTGDGLFTQQTLYISADHYNPITLFLKAEDQTDYPTTMPLYINCQFDPATVPLILANNYLENLKTTTLLVKAGPPKIGENITLYIQRDFEGNLGTLPMYINTEEGRLASLDVYINGVYGNMENVGLYINGEGVTKDNKTLYTHGF